MAKRIQAELAMVYDLATDKTVVLGQNVNRNYGTLTETQIPGTADLMTYFDEQAIVVDIKTGQRVTPAEKNWQLRTLALMASRAFGVSLITVALAYLDEEARWSFDVATFNAFEIDSFRVELLKLVDHIKAIRTVIDAGQTPDVRMGDDWCKYCPAFRYCPAQTALVRAISVEAFTTIADEVNALSPERVAHVWTLLKQYKPILERIEAAIKIYVADTPVQLANGKVLKQIPATRSEVISHVALPIVRALCGPEVAEAASKTSQAALRRVVPEDQLNRVMDLIRIKGGIEYKTDLKVIETNG